MIIPWIILLERDKFFKNYGFFSEEKWKTILAAFFLNSGKGLSKYFKTISFIYKLLCSFEPTSEPNFASNSKEVEIFS